MKCNSCGREISEDERFCIYCGAAQVWQCRNDNSKNSVSYVGESKRSNKKIAVIVIALVVCMGLAGTGVYFVLDKIQSNDLYLYQDKDTELWGYIDGSGEEIIKPQFNLAMEFTEGIAPVYDDESGLWGYIDKKGNYVIEPEYSMAYCFQEGLAPVCNSRERWGYIDKNGTYIIEPEYKDVYGFDDGIAAVCNREGLWGYIDDTGEYMIKPQFGFTYGFVNGYAMASDYETSLWGFIDVDGNYIIDPVFLGCDNFSEGYAAVHDSRTGLWGYIDERGKYVIKPQFEMTHPFSEGYASVCDVNTGEWHFIDKKGNSFTEGFDLASSFSEGYASVFDVDTGLWGYIDETGEYVIKPQFRQANSFIDGIAMVYYENGLCDYINKDGKSIIKSRPVPEFKEPAQFKVECKLSYQDRIGPFYFEYDSFEGTGVEYYCDVDINIPELCEGVKGYKEINQEIEWTLSDYEAIAEQSSEGDYTVIESDRLAVVKVTYNVYEYNDTVAFVISHKVAPYATGNSPSYMMYYYDKKNEEWINHEEYAALNGYTLEEVFDEYVVKTGGGYSQFDISSLDNQGIIFYFNDAGELVFEESIL